MTQKTIIGYKLVKEYPLKQIGDMVVLKKLSNGWYWEKNIIEKVELPILKTDFFEPIYSKRAVGEMAILKLFNRQVRISKILTNGKYEVELEGKTKKNVSEKDLEDIKSYWFFNSSFAICQIEITSKEKLEDWEARKTIGNCFDTKEQCRHVVSILKKTLQDII